MSTPLGPSSAALIQCQNCYKPESPDTHLQVCSTCKRTHYCSRACQTAHWKSHRPVCRQAAQLLAALAQRAAEHARAADAPIVLSTDGARMTDLRAVESRLKTFILLHKASLYWAAAQALDLPNTPARMRREVVSIMLDAAPFPSAPPGQAFTVASAEVFALEDARLVLAQTSTAHTAILDAQLAKSAAMRREGGERAGIVIMFIAVTGKEVMHITPMAITESLAGMEVLPDWEERLKQMVTLGVSV